MELTAKQEVANNYLEDKATTELLFGGSAGGGKTAFLCMWLISMCTRYPGTRWLMGRAKLKALKDTTLKTFFEIAPLLGINPAQWKYNSQSGTITWWNGSEIVLKDLFAYPSDPNFDSLGGLELTGAALDEVAEITVRARNAVKSRIRFKLKEFNLLPRMFMTCNPCKSWPYTDFYKPARDGELKHYRQFIQSLPTDNPHLAEVYLEALDQLDPVMRARLLLGDWEFESDDTQLMTHDAITDMFTNDHVEGGRAAITCDVARFGSDKTVIVLWHGLRVEKVWTYAKTGIDQVVDLLKTKAKEYNVRRSRIVVDEDGVGGGVVDVGKFKGFVNNSKPVKERGKVPNFENLKSQCYYLLAKKVNDGEVYIYPDVECRDELIEEMVQVKAKHIDRDQRLGVVPKDRVTQLLGRSPDHSDAIMLRMYLELKKSTIKSGGLV